MKDIFGDNQDADDILTSINTVVLYFLAILYMVTFIFCSVKVAPYLLKPRGKDETKAKKPKVSG